MRGRAALSIALIATALAACASTPPRGSTVLAGVDLSRSFVALGTEPFWDVHFTGDEIRYRGMDDPEVRMPQPRIEITGASAIVRARLPDGRAFDAAFVAETCSDGMSDEVYPLTAVIRIDDAVLRGCAIATPADPAD